MSIVARALLVEPGHPVEEPRLAVEPRVGAAMKRTAALVVVTAATSRPATVSRALAKETAAVVVLFMMCRTHRSASFKFSGNLVDVLED